MVVQFAKYELTEHVVSGGYIHVPDKWRQPSDTVVSYANEKKIKSFLGMADNTSKIVGQVRKYDRNESRKPKNDQSVLAELEQLMLSCTTGCNIGRDAKFFPCKELYTTSGDVAKFGDFVTFGDEEKDSIASYFTGAHRGLNIGDSLDLLLLGRCQPEDFPKMIVTDKDGEWFTADNRRLWVFKKAFELGNLSEIDVEIGYVNPRKFTTRNFGRSIRVRGDPGGNIWRRYEKEKNGIANRNADMNYLERKLGRLQLHSVPTSEIKSNHVLNESKSLDFCSPKRLPVSGKVDTRDKRTSNDLTGTSFHIYNGDSTAPIFTGLSDRTHDRKDTNQMVYQRSPSGSIQRVALPSEIRYSKRKVGRLLDGIPLLEHVDNIATGATMDYIKVFKHGKETIALQNRKLWILQMAEELKLSFDVPLKYIEVPDSFSSSFKRAVLPCLEYPRSFKFKTLKHLKLCKTLYNVNVQPSKVLYTVNTVSSMLNSQKVGEYLDDFITKMSKGGIHSKFAFDSPMSSPIKVISVGHLYFTLENRKLWLSNVLEQLGLRERVTLEVKINVDDRFLIYPDPLSYQTEDTLQVIRNPGGKLWKRLLMAQKDRLSEKLA
ncbi:hypothetical protein FSP39_020272 [Pinctada imbricata]|uniref:Uncharacterized protein n=1 Tax=Pinctada imbricata TaxID=66713 RepID=A0AA89C4U7_PINIB|nr:hypothetical protein FSP39_020272 [Pinctada imbricata]